jgi:hypothetical protein
VYKDVAATEKERDFVHSRSCEKMSGECNAHAAKSSYKKGEYVTPEDLERMYKGLEAELSGSEEPEEPGAAAARAAAPSPAESAGPAGEAAPAGTGSAKAAAAAKAEEAAYAAMPPFLHPAARRALAKTVAWLSPTAAESPSLAGRLLLTAAALAACALFALLRRR